MLKASEWSWEVVVVDDGSKDETVKVVQQIATEQGTDQVRVLMLDDNCGKGGAIQKGMLRARGDRILMADADGATAIDDLRFLMESMDKGADIAVGSRAHMEQQSIAKVSTTAPLSSPCLENMVPYRADARLSLLGLSVGPVWRSRHPVRLQAV